MQGLLAQPQQAAPQQVNPFQQNEKQANIDAQSLQKHIASIVKAAQHVMYSPETRKMFLGRLKKQLQAKPPAEAAASTAVDIITLLAAQSQFSMNAKAIVPAGILITGEVLSFISKAFDKPVTEEVSNMAMQLFAKEIMTRTGADKIGGQDVQPV